MTLVAFGAAVAFTNQPSSGDSHLEPHLEPLEAQTALRLVPKHKSSSSTLPARAGTGAFFIDEEVLRACRNEHAGDERSRNSQYSLAHVMEPRLLHHPQRAPSLQNVQGGRWLAVLRRGGRRFQPAPACRTPRPCRRPLAQRRGDTCHTAPRVVVGVGRETSVTACGVLLVRVDGGAAAAACFEVPGSGGGGARGVAARG